MHSRYALAALALALLLGPAASAATITVTSSSDAVATDGNCTLREAVQAANTNAAVDNCAAGDPDGDTVLFGVLVTSITLTGGEILVTDDVTLDGGLLRVVVDGAGASRLFDIDAAPGSGTSQRVQFTNLVLRNGNASLGSSSAPDAGGAVDLKAGSQATFTNVDVTGSSCGINGGGIHGAGNTDIVITTSAIGSSLLQNNEARGDEANRGGGGVWGAGTVTITGNVTIDGNRATGTSGSGGGVFNLGGTLVIGTGVVISNNTANRAGGGIEAADASTTTLTGVVFTGNSAGSNPGNGGAFHISGAGNATITGGSATDNVAAREGGGFWNNTGMMTIAGTTFTDNVAQGNAADDGGGAVFNNGGTTVLTNVTATGNQATGTSGSGGALMSLGGTMTVTGGTLSGNLANRAGAGAESAGALMTLTDVTVDDNDIPVATAMPGNGGGVHAGGGTLTVRGGTYSGNDATEGGALWASGTLVVEPSAAGATMITGNTGRGPAADNGGGGIYLDGSATGTITGATLMNNAATGTSGSGGGLLVTPGASATVTGGTFTGNRANRAGAGIEVAGGTLTLVGVTVDDNDIPAATAMPGNGGGLHAGGGTVTIRGGAFLDNDATEGGALWSSGVLSVEPDDADTATTLSGNTGRGPDATNGGGGVFAETGATVMLRETIITDNAATGTAGSGGGIFVADGATLTMEGGSVSMNEANRAGAGIEVAGDGTTPAGTALVLTRVTVDANLIATAAPGNGGGLHVGGAGVVTIRKSTFSNNMAREGAGLWMAGTSTLDLALSTVSGNMATEDGGGVYDNGGASAATITLADVTVAGNTAGGIGGGLLSESTDGASFSLQNSIVADNAAPTGPDASGQIRSEGTNLFETTTGATVSGPATGDVTGMDPMLGPLADNGGPTLTHLPDAGSPAVNAGQSTYTVDQRDFLRAVGQDDIGAVEFGAMIVAAGDDPQTSATVLALAPARPNPMRGQGTLVFTVAESGDARVEVFNTLGQRVLVAFDGTATAGTDVSVPFDASSLAPGLYVVRLQSGGAQATQRVTVVR